MFREKIKMSSTDLNVAAIKCPRERSETSAFGIQLSLFSSITTSAWSSSQTTSSSCLDQSINKMVPPLATIKLSNPDNSESIERGERMLSSV